MEHRPNTERCKRFHVSSVFRQIFFYGPARLAAPIGPASLPRHWARARSTMLLVTSFLGREAILSLSLSKEGIAFLAASPIVPNTEQAQQTIVSSRSSKFRTQAWMVSTQPVFGVKNFGSGGVAARL